MADFLFDEGKNKIEGLKKTEINQALESKADAQAVANAFQSINEALNGKADATAVNQALQTINNSLQNKVNHQELTNAIDNVTNWRAKEKFDGTYTGWGYDSNLKLYMFDNRQTAVIPMVNGASYKISADGTYNRFLVFLTNSLLQGVSVDRIYANTSPSGREEYELVNSNNYAYLLVTLNYGDSEFDCDFSVIETIKDNSNEFFVNGISVLLKDNLDGYLRTITDGNYMSIADFVDSNYCLNQGKIDPYVAGKTMLCPMKNGMKYIINVSGNINRFVVAVADDNTPNTTYTRIYNSEITTLDNRHINYEYTNVDNKKYLLVFYYYGTPATAIDRIIMELSFNGKMTVSGIEVATPDQIPLLFDNYISNTIVNNVQSVSELYSLYDELYSLYPDYITKNILGQDSAGNNIIEYVLTSGNYNSQSGQRTEDSEIVKPKILIVTGVHGYERSSVMATYQFVCDLCGRNSKLADIRENYIIKIIPCVTPSSFNADTRINSNGVNINRNFSDYWTLTPEGSNYSGASAADQLETQIVQSWIDDNNNAILYIDFHNSGYENEVSYIQGANVVENMNNIKLGYLKQLYITSVYWQKIENFLSNLIFAYTGAEDQIASSNCYAHITGNILSILLETSWNQNGSGKHSALTIKTGAEALGNLLIGILKIIN